MKHWLLAKFFKNAWSDSLQAFIFTYICCNFRGAVQAEIIPYEPDADHAAEGKSTALLCIYIATPEVIKPFTKWR